MTFQRIVFVAGNEIGEEDDDSVMESEVKNSSVAHINDFFDDEDDEHEDEDDNKDNDKE